MLTESISTIFFDVGGTLRRNIARDEESRAVIVQQILNLLGSATSAVEFARTLAARADAYEQWASTRLIELDETRLWTDWMLPDYAPEKIRPIARQLNSIWRDAICTRVLFPETIQTVLGLRQAGYRLGVVSNTTSSTDAPSMLMEAGILDCFEVVLLSCVLGKRKPDPAILIEAAAFLGVPPSQCAYIGDRPGWDVIAARGASFGKAVILRDPSQPIAVPLPPGLIPDHFINTLFDLFTFFSPLPGLPSRQ